MSNHSLDAGASNCQAVCTRCELAGRPRQEEHTAVMDAQSYRVKSSDCPSRCCRKHGADGPALSPCGLSDSHIFDSDPYPESRIAAEAGRGYVTQTIGLLARPVFVARCYRDSRKPAHVCPHLHLAARHHGAPFCLRLCSAAAAVSLIAVISKMSRSSCVATPVRSFGSTLRTYLHASRNASAVFRTTWTDVVGRPVGRYEPRHAVMRNVKQSIDDDYIHRVFFEEPDLVRVCRIDDRSRHSRQTFQHPGGNRPVRLGHHPDTPCWPFELKAQ